MLNCINVTRLLSESMERELTIKERMGLKMHLVMCSGCRNFGKQMHTLRLATKLYSKPPSGLSSPHEEPQSDE